MSFGRIAAVNVYMIQKLLQKALIAAMAEVTQAKKQLEHIEHALDMRELAAVFERVLVRHGDDLIVNLRIERLRHEARADALDLVRAGRAARQDGRGGRFDREGGVHAR